MTIRVGLIGLNYGAQVHLPTYKAHAKYEVTAVCARTRATAEKIAKDHNIPRWYTDARDLIADKAVDLVSIATPPGAHAGFAAAALAAGKHVVVEIGFVCDAPDARLLTTVARERKRVGATAYVLRFSPLLRHVGDMLKQNALGQIGLMRFDSFSNFLARPNPNYRWIWEAETGGGILLNFTAHAIDLARHWLGPVVEVEATLTTLARAHAPKPRQAAAQPAPKKTGLLARIKPAESPPKIEGLADDTGFATLYFENGAMGVFSHSAATAYTRTRLELHGAEASVVVEGFGDEATLAKMGEAEVEPLFPSAVYLEESLGHSGFLGGFRVFLDRLGAAIDDQQIPPDLPTFADGWETARVLDAIKLASRDKRRVRVEEVEAGWRVK
jgi:predicted dehydrogenase